MRNHPVGSEKVADEAEGVNIEGVRTRLNSRMIASRPMNGPGSGQLAELSKVITASGS